MWQMHQRMRHKWVTTQNEFSDDEKANECPSQPLFPAVCSVGICTLSTLAVPNTGFLVNLFLENPSHRMRWVYSSDRPSVKLFFFLALCTVQLSKTRKELFTCSRGWVRIRKGHKQAEFKPNVKCINDETGTIWQRKDGWRWTCRCECWHLSYFTGK